MFNEDQTEALIQIIQQGIDGLITAEEVIAKIEDFTGSKMITNEEALANGW